MGMIMWVSYSNFHQEGWAYMCMHYFHIESFYYRVITPLLWKELASSWTIKYLFYSIVVWNLNSLVSITASPEQSIQHSCPSQTSTMFLSFSYLSQSNYAQLSLCSLSAFSIMLRKSVRDHIEPWNPQIQCLETTYRNASIASMSR